jgi:hypothetical protein
VPLAFVSKLPLEILSVRSAQKLSTTHLMGVAVQARRIDEFKPKGNSNEKLIYLFFA